MRSTQQFSITLPNEMDDAVRAKVAAGEYATESEVIRDGLRVLLARDRAVEEWLRKDVAATYDKLKADPSKVDSAVEEVLRYWAPSQYQGRLSVNDTEWHGVTVKAGKPVFIVTGAANHDEREFGPDATVFDIDREQRLAISLGHGIHTCLGAALARMECAVAIDEIRRRWPDYTIDEDRCERVQMSNVAGYSSVPFATST